MYGFIHCCLEDMVLQLFGEAAWREILNISGIKLRGASFLMHQVYDDEMTFKLVAAASSVSGLPVEVCLEEFGKHFLVYCQKNGYDQILRVLGSNLYDFLTNLDNLHDHLASIYPGMRAPSFRVTRQLNTNQRGGRATEAATLLKPGAELQKQNSSCSMAGSMYLHYYSERAGLSPIVKGLVLAVAREFFQTDIQVTECELASGGERRPGQPSDDHVVLKIDRRAGTSVDEEPSAKQVASQQSEPAEQQQHYPSTPQMLQSKSMLNIYDSLSVDARDSLVSSELMMQTFPFHVIFDRRFEIVQVGKSLLRVTSRLWRKLAAEPNSKPANLGDLFRIVRPKIEFTFDAIADHTNQVFVVKTRPLVLNADALRQQGAAVLGRGAPAGGVAASARAPTIAASAAARQRPPGGGCPFDRIAAEARRRASAGCPNARVAEANGVGAAGRVDEPEPAFGKPGGADNDDDINNNTTAQLGGQIDELGEPVNHVSLRLKGQMIVLLGGELCLYLCSPRVDHLDQLLECGVKMSDFALHDRARELMLMSHTHKEDREAVKKLDQASNDLKKMDTKLRAENKRTNEVLHNIFPAKIASLLSHGHQVESESFDLVTCLYSDIIGFTRMCGSENVRPIDIVRLLNTMYLQFDNLTTIHGVFKVETIGDAYVVVGGLPEPAEDHADRCVKMGLDMVKVIGTVRSPADQQPIQMRIGIHSGPVMAGIVGIRVPRYSLFGNTTTLANQLETHGVGGKIHISDFTLKNLIKRDRFVVEDNPNELGAIPFVTYFVTNYLRDERETSEHERILEEQLIKDFELMGNELELVDDSYQLYARGQPAGAGGGTTDRGRSPPPPSLLDEQGVPATLTKPAGHEQPFGRGRAREQPGAAASPSLPRPRDQQRPLAEFLADELLPERLILMDIEGSPDSDTSATLATNPRGQDEGGGGARVESAAELGRELSGAIISAALKQVAAAEHQQRGGASKTSEKSGDELLVLLCERAASNELQVELFSRPPEGGGANAQRLAIRSARPDCCPLCAGGGRLDAATGHSLRLRLARPTPSDAQQKGPPRSQALSALEWLAELLASATKTAAARSESSRIVSSGADVFGGRGEWAGCQVEQQREAPRAAATRRRAGGERTAPVSPARPLSSSIQRMKRMDTLKRRKRSRASDSPAGGTSDCSLGPQQLAAEQTRRPIVEEERTGGDDASEDGADGERQQELADGEGGTARVAPEHSASRPEVGGEARTIDGAVGDTTGAREGAAAASGAKRDELAAGVSERGASFASHQSLRASLAGLVSALGSRARPTTRRLGSLNPFAGLAGFLSASPFASPSRRASPAPPAAARRARCSSAAPAGQARQTSNSSNCSCLKSSASSQSFVPAEEERRGSVRAAR